jgi:hypothetical protein
MPTNTMFVHASLEAGATGLERLANLEVAATKATPKQASARRER